MFQNYTPGKRRSFLRRFKSRRGRNKTRHRPFPADFIRGWIIKAPSLRRSSAFRGAERELREDEGEVCYRYYFSADQRDDIDELFRLSYRYEFDTESNVPR